MKIWIVYYDPNRELYQEEYGDFYYIREETGEKALKKVKEIRPEKEWKVREAVFDEEGFLT